MRGSSYECALHSWQKRINKKDQPDFLDVAALGQIGKLYEWVIKRGWKVKIKWHCENSADYATKTVMIDKALPPRIALYFFLHECGHILIGPSPKRFNENYGEQYYDKAMSEESESTVHKLAVLHEEMEAWTRGFKLAKRLNINIDKDDFNKSRICALKSYTEWALNHIYTLTKK